MLLAGYTGNALATPYVTVDKTSFHMVTVGVGSHAFEGRWEWKEQSGDIAICHSTTRQGCVVAICIKSYLWYCDSYKDAYINKYIYIRNGTTAAQAQAAWAAKYGTSGSWSVSNWDTAVSISTCFGIVTWPTNNYSLSDFIAGSSCAVPPPVNLTCTTSGKVTIDYGTLDGSKLNGVTASTNLSITCNQSATATVKMNDSVIDLGRKGDLTAAISINGKDLASGSDVAVTNGTVTTTITSTLKAKGTPAAGAFEGSGVLIIGYY